LVRAKAQKALGLYAEAYDTLEAHHALRTHHKKIATYWNSIYRKLNETLGELHATQATLANRTAELERLSRTDALTGLHNRRSLYERAALEIQEIRRTHRSLAVALFDVDHFKRINDTYGHNVGDSVLKSVARAAGSELRSEDFLARLGGEEFAVLIPDCTFAEAAAVAERMRRSIARSSITLDTGDSASVTASFGVTRFDSESDTFDAVLNRADGLCYSAKNAGRNSVRESA
jgi:diguanylate cyclase (GGDEF)-like protein